VRVRAALADLGWAGDVLVTSASTHTAGDAAVAAGCELGQIVKTLAIFVSGKPLLALVAGDRRLDDRLLAQHFSVGRKQIKLANADQVLALTGYAVGGVCAFGLAQPLEVVADDSLRRFETVWSAGGTASAIFPIILLELVRFTDARFVAIAT
jgi:prolyl-tRNA editing enzyme YbaK/EbsC (Cys-tRNA(Pro) deacylase)